MTSFNIRNSDAKDGLNDWDHRQELFFHTLGEEHPDLIGLQEVTHKQAQNIREKLADYEFVGVGRNDGKEKGEYAPILFKRDRFERRDWGTIWLSPTPDAIGSKGWDADLPRIATWAKLIDKQNGGREFLYVNTHFDHVGKVARLESAKLLRRKVAELAPSIPVLITGDFNATEDAPPYAALVKPDPDAPPKLIDAFRATHVTRSPDEASFNGFKGTRTGSRIDWILHTPDWTTVSASIDYASKDGRYPSDQYPVHAELRWSAK